MISAQCNRIFEQVISDYHQYNDIFKVIDSPYEEGTIDHILYTKCWIDTAQWHMEDEIRNPNIDSSEVIKWKRAIDKSNQDRTDIVEVIDSYFYEKFKDVSTSPTAKINTESPAWAIDRLSILALKVYLLQCSEKLSILLQQQVDLSLAIDELLEDIEKGEKYMKVYRQMKMYNDPNLNPVLYNNKK